MYLARGVHKKNLRQRLVFKKSEKKKTTHPPKNANRFFFYVQSRPPPTQKNLWVYEIDTQKAVFSHKLCTFF